MKTLKTSAAIFLLSLSVAVAGCASKAQYHYARGNHADMIKEFEGNKLQALNSVDLYYLCPSFLAMRHYQKSLDCADELERRDQNVLYGISGQYFTVSMFKASAYLIKLQAYLDMGELAKAVDYGEKAYAILEAQSGLARVNMDHSGIDIIGDLGIAYAVSGNPGKAREMFGRLDQYPMSILRRHVLDPYRRLKMIRLAFAMKNYDEVLALCNKDEAIFDGKWWSSLPGHRVAYSRLVMDFIRAKSHFESGNLKAAGPLYARLLETPRINESSDLYLYSLADLGAIFLKEGKYAEGRELLRKAVDVMEMQRSSIATESAKIGFVGDKQAIYHNLIRALYDDKQYEKSFEYVERAKSRALIDLLASKQDFANKGNDKNEIKNALAMNSRAEVELFSPDDSIDKSKSRSLQIRIRQDLERMAPELASLVTVTSPPIGEIQSHIQPDEALIEYYYKENDMYVFVLSDGKLQVLRLGSRGLAEEVEKFRKNIGNPGSNRFMESAARLHARLFKPVESVVSRKNLIIVAHGALHYLPFNALHDGKAFLIERYSIRMMPSAGAMKYLVARKAGKRGDMIVFGNPDLGDRRYDLAFAEKEAIEVSKGKPQSRVFLRKDATLGAFAKYAGGFGYIHLATHGRFDPVTPLKSALLLAPEAGSDGMLTADKLYSLELNSDLVTLSACETGLSRVANGDDLVGLTRGFLYAGASSVVASLWKVDDLATSQLMARFYRELEKTNKREALRIAQLAAKEKFPHPYYWASFQLTGNAN